MPDDPRDPFGAALAAIRSRLREGRFGWGEPLVIKDLALDLRLSATPVREALALLAGERLIERRRGQGYVFPGLTTADVIDLYDLHWTYLHAALTLHGRGAATLQKVLGSHGDAPALPALFEAVVEHTGNEALIQAHADVLARLSGPARLEAELVSGLEARVAAMTAAIGRGEIAALLDQLEAFHRARSSQAGEIARRLRRGPQI
ncbi:GntR family transcriptional regulator [Brevundimonas staleyi]|uniref:GntR family transcriptional regulator n=1 Tax=Brevundimonas staleyi TaxID=74326 RepID=A0ABW0FVL0_9CAUL